MIDIAKEITNALTDYTKEVTESIEEEKKKLAQEAVAKLKRISPEETGEYAKGWTYKKTKNGYVIYNRNKPQITHLLEKGHAKRGGGRVSGIPHISLAERDVIREFQERVEKIIKNGG